MNFVRAQIANRVRMLEKALHVAVSDLEPTRLRPGLVMLNAEVMRLALQVGMLGIQMAHYIEVLARHEALMKDMLDVQQKVTKLSGWVEAHLLKSLVALDDERKAGLDSTSNSQPEGADRETAQAA